MKHIKVNLQAIMDFFDTNVNQLANGIDERPDTIKRLRDNKSVRLTKSLLEKICTYFQINIDDLLNFEDQLKTKFNTVPLSHDEKFILTCNLKTILQQRNLTIEQAAIILDENYEIVRRLNSEITERYPIRLIEKVLNTFHITINDLFRLHIVKDPSAPKRKTAILKNKVKIRPNLKELLKEKNMTLKQLSEDTQLSYQMLLRFQQNKMTRYPKHLLETLCTYFEITIDQLLHMEKEK